MNACRGIFFGLLIAIPLNAVLALVVWLLLKPWHVSYWLALGGVLAVATALGGIISYFGMRKAR